MSNITIGDGTYCLNLHGFEQRDGATINIWKCNGHDSQKWVYEDGAIKLATNRAFCLNLHSASKANGATINLWTYTGHPAQKWDICGDAVMSHKEHKWVLNLHGLNLSNGGMVNLWEANGHESQKWIWSVAVGLELNLEPFENPGKVVDRVAGVILGVFIGNALGMGVHWQYDLDKLEADRGYVKDYLTPLPGTYHAGFLKAGQLEVQGACAKLLLQSLAERGRLDQDDYLERFEKVILRDPKMNGTRNGGRYGWTDKVILDFWKKRVKVGLPWEQSVPKRSDTPDAAVRGALLAARYHASPYELCVQVNNHAKAQTGDSSIHQHSVAFALTVAGLIEGQPLQGIGSKFYAQVGAVLPFTSIHSDKDHDERYGDYSEPDSLDFLDGIWKGVGGLDKKFRFEAEPPHRGVKMYGQACAFWECLSSAYYCIARNPNDFEAAILCSVNGGGTTTVRSSLVGAVMGAQCGLSKIPPRFIEGLDDSGGIVAWAKQIAQESLHGIEGDKWQWPADEASLDDWILL